MFTQGRFNQIRDAVREHAILKEGELLRVLVINYRSKDECLRSQITFDLKELEDVIVDGDFMIVPGQLNETVIGLKDIFITIVAAGRGIDALSYKYAYSALFMEDGTHLPVNVKEHTIGEIVRMMQISDIDEPKENPDDLLD